MQHMNIRYCLNKYYMIMDEIMYQKPKLIKDHMWMRDTIV